LFLFLFLFRMNQVEALLLHVLRQCIGTATIFCMNHCSLSRNFSAAFDSTTEIYFLKWISLYIYIYIYIVYCILQTLGFQELEEALTAATKTPPRRQGLGFSGSGGSSGMRAAAVLGASVGAAPRRATDGGAPPGTSDGDTPEAGRKVVMTLSKRTGGGGTL
jgi:hypothetical protein